MRAALAFVMLTITQAGACAAPIPPELDALIKPVSQCRLENGVARTYGGAIRRAEPEQCRAGEEVGALSEARSVAEMMGKLRPPVEGTVVRRFGEPDEKGAPSHGIVLRTRPGAQVKAPFDSRIMFAQPYKEYGHLLILSTRDGYHFVLAGMTKIYGVEGQTLLEGEPVGVMAAAGAGAPEGPIGPGTDDAPGATAGPELYFEIRKDGKPTDPLPWLAMAGLERTSP